jgi:hypothetical protein
VKKKLYFKPEIEKVVLDNTISLQMQSDTPPTIPDPRGAGSKSPNSDPFPTPFEDKPFN